MSSNPLGQDEVDEAHMEPQISPVALPTAPKDQPAEIEGQGPSKYFMENISLSFQNSRVAQALVNEAPHASWTSPHLRQRAA